MIKKSQQFEGTTYEEEYDVETLFYLFIYFYLFGNHVITVKETAVPPITI